MKSVAKITSDGYVVEASFKWTDITPKPEMRSDLNFRSMMLMQVAKDWYIELER